MSCSGAIHRWKKAPVDFKKIIDEGKEFIDADFPADHTSIVWPEFTNGGMPTSE
jgi:hypothetical protein